MMSQYIVTTILSCAITLVMSVTYLLTMMAIVAMYYDCFLLSRASTPASYYVMKILYKQYVQDIFCPEAQKLFDLTPNTQYFGLILCSIACTICSFTFCILLTASTILKGWYQYLELVTFLYAGFYVSTVTCDIVIASYFARDYTTLSEILNRQVIGENSNYTLDLMRIGTLILIFVVLKGILIHIVNLILILISLITVPEYVRRRKNRESSPRSNVVPLVHMTNAALAVIKERLRTLNNQAAVERLARLPMRHINSVDDLPRSRRLHSTRARRARSVVRPDIPLRRLRFEELPSPPLSPPPPPPRSLHLPPRCTCVGNAASALTGPTSGGAGVTVTTTAVVEAMEMAVAGPTRSPHTSRSQSTGYTITEL